MGSNPLLHLSIISNPRKLNSNLSFQGNSGFLLISIFIIIYFYNVYLVTLSLLLFFGLKP
jgi:hypothetical protein